MTHSLRRSEEPRLATRVSRRNTLELARIYVSSAAHTAALESLEKLPPNGWDEEVQLLRAESLIGLGRLVEADQILGPPSLPPTGSQRELDQWRFLLQLRIQHRRGQYPSVAALGRAQLEIASRRPSVLLARTAMVVAQSLLAMKKPGDAREFYEQVLDLYRRLGHREGQADALLGIANTHLLDCRWDKADAVYQEVRFRYEELGLTDKALAAWINIGVLRVKRGELLAGRELLLDALSRATQLGAVRRSHTIRLGLAMAEIRIGDLQAARPHLAHVLRAARKNGIARDLGLGLELLGEAQLAEGKAHLAERTLRRALRVARAIAPDGDIVFEVERRLAEVAVERGELAKAAQLASAARDRANRFGDAYEVATCERVLAEIDLLHGDAEGAYEHLEIANRILGGLGETFERARVAVLRVRVEGALGTGAPGDVARLARKALEACGMGADLSAGRMGPLHRDIERATQQWGHPVHGAVGSEPAGGRSASARRRTTAGWLRELQRSLGQSDLADLRASGMITRNPALIRTLVLAKAVSRLDVPVLISGEAGCGLEAVSRLVHRWSGRSGAFLPFHCAELPPDVLARELCGEKGRAGIAQMAEGGTVFLDGISALGSESQARLAAWIRSQRNGDAEAPVRVIAAWRPARTGRSVGLSLRDELRRELERVILEVPSLRERMSDIPLLVREFLSQIEERTGQSVAFPPLSLLAEWRLRPWEGNVRELLQEVEAFARLLHREGPIRPS